MPVELPLLVAERFVVLQDSAGLGVENGNGLWGAHLKDGGGVRAGIRVQRDGLGPGRDAEVDLGAGGGDDLAVTDDPGGGQGRRVVRALRPVLVRAYLVGRELYGLRRAPERSGPLLLPGQRAPADNSYETYFEKDFDQFFVT